MTKFAPTHHQAYQPRQGTMDYGNPPDLAAKQLDTLLDELTSVQTFVSFRRNDLIGYYTLQNGGSEATVDSVIDAVTTENDGPKIRFTGRLASLLPSILDDLTTPAIMERIQLDGPIGEDAAEIAVRAAGGLLELRGGLDENGQQTPCLFPADGARLTYLGRLTKGFSRKVGNTSSALIDVSSDETLHSLVVTSQTGRDLFLGITGLQLFSR